MLSTVFLYRCSFEIYYLVSPRFRTRLDLRDLRGLGAVVGYGKRINLSWTARHLPNMADTANAVEKLAEQAKIAQVSE